MENMLTGVVGGVAGASGGSEYAPVDGGFTATCRCNVSNTSHTPSMYDHVCPEYVLNIIKSSLITLYYQGAMLGNGVMLSPHLMLTAAHVVEGHFPQTLRGVGYDAATSSLLVRQCSGCFEISKTKDYALLYFRDAFASAGVEVTRDIPVPNALIASRSFEGDPYRVFDIPDIVQVSSVIIGHYYSEKGISGSGYFDTQGRMFGYHVGAEKLSAITGGAKAGMSFAEVAPSSEKSVLSYVLDEKPIIVKELPDFFSKKLPYTLWADYQVDEEGAKSAQMLTEKVAEMLTTALKLKVSAADLYQYGFTTTKQKLLSTSTTTLEKIINCKRLKGVFYSVYSECIKQGGIHGLTNKYSIASSIESDHTLPSAVWRYLALMPKTTATIPKTTAAIPKTIAAIQNEIAAIQNEIAAIQKKTPAKQKKTPEEIKKIAKKIHAIRGKIFNGKDRISTTFENNLPAMTIPYSIHRVLKTTGNSDESNRFRARLIKLCKRGNYVEALMKCYEDYADKGLNLPEYGDAINEYLQWFENHDFLTMGQVVGLMFYIRSLTIKNLTKEIFFESKNMYYYKKNGEYYRFHKSSSKVILL